MESNTESIHGTEAPHSAVGEGPGGDAETPEKAPRTLTGSQGFTMLESPGFFSVCDVDGNCP